MQNEPDEPPSVPEPPELALDLEFLLCTGLAQCELVCALFQLCQFCAFSRPLPFGAALC